MNAVVTAVSETVTPLYRGDDAMREQIRATMSVDRKLSQSALAKEAGLSSTTFNQWLNGGYPGDNAAVETKLAIWLEAHQARMAQDEALPDAPSYVDTPTAARVMGALGYAQMAGDIAVAYGAAGLGKTTACRRYQSSRPNVWIATMDPACSGVVTCLQEVSDALGLPESGGARSLSRAIAKRIDGTRGLLIIDEAQHLSVAALDQLRSIYDATGVGIALVGNEGVYARMAGGRHAQALDRLFSRIGKRLALRKSSDADIKALIKAWGIGDGKCLPTLMEIAHGSGALRSLTKTLRLASMQAAAENRHVDCSDVRAAARELGSAA